MFKINGASKRAIAIGTAWAAAYALIFQILCSSLVLASISPASAGFTASLCTAVEHDQNSAEGSGTEAPVAGKGVYCPVCTSHFFGSAVLPEPPALFRAVAAPAPAHPAFIAQLPPSLRLHHERARDPPRQV